MNQIDLNHIPCCPNIQYFVPKITNITPKRENHDHLSLWAASPRCSTFSSQRSTAMPCCASSTRTCGILRAPLEPGVPAVNHFELLAICW